MALLSLTLTSFAYIRLCLYIGKVFKRQKRVAADRERKQDSDECDDSDVDDDNSEAGSEFSG